jgi:hypothetical protein
MNNRRPHGLRIAQSRRYVSLTQRYLAENGDTAWRGYMGKARQCPDGSSERGEACVDTSTISRISHAHNTTDTTDGVGLKKIATNRQRMITGLARTAENGID